MSEPENPYAYQRGKYIDIVLSGEPTRLHTGNTHIFSHQLQREGDHIYIMHRELDDESVEASYLWRMNFEQQGRGEKYDDLAGRLGKIGCEVHDAAFMNEHDMDRFYKSFGRYALIDIVQHELTERHERLIAALGQTLGAMPSADIMAEFETPNDFRPYPQRWA